MKQTLKPPGFSMGENSQASRLASLPGSLFFPPASLSFHYCSTISLAPEVWGALLLLCPKYSQNLFCLLLRIVEGGQDFKKRFNSLSRQTKGSKQKNTKMNHYSKTELSTWSPEGWPLRRPLSKSLPAWPLVSSIALFHKR